MDEADEWDDGDRADDTHESDYLMNQMKCLVTVFAAWLTSSNAKSLSSSMASLVVIFAITSPIHNEAVPLEP